jgi:hypothetical protein
MKYFLVFLVFTLTFVGLTQSADARGADEPCSYLDPSKIRDSSGNCVVGSAGSAHVVSQARSSSEPCSYLSPTKYIRDSAGNCVLAQQNIVSNIAPAPVPVLPSTHTTTIIHAPPMVPVTAGSSANLSDVGVIALLGIFALIAYKIFGGRLRQPRMKYRPRPTQKPENFAENHVAVEDNSSVSEDTDRWNGGYYDDSTKEKFK